MSSTIEVLNQKIDAKHLLKHPFYVAWSKGELSLEDLQSYARQYFTHVRAFPAYLSEMHSRCEDLASRQTIAANLANLAFAGSHALWRMRKWLQFKEDQDPPHHLRDFWKKTMRGL